jgi:hypothetical protein
MAVAGQSTRDEDSINPCFKSLQRNQTVQLPGAGDFHNLDRWRILKPETAGQICSGIGTMCAAVSEDLEIVLIVIHG